VAAPPYHEPSQEEIEKWKAHFKKKHMEVMRKSKGGKPWRDTDKVGYNLCLTPGGIVFTPVQV
jgi:hypothetical protein